MQGVFYQGLATGSLLRVCRLFLLCALRRVDSSLIVRFFPELIPLRDPSLREPFEAQGKPTRSLGESTGEKAAAQFTQDDRYLSLVVKRRSSSANAISYTRIISHENFGFAA